MYFDFCIIYVSSFGVISSRLFGGKVFCMNGFVFNVLFEECFFDGVDYIVRAIDEVFSSLVVFFMFVEELLYLSRVYMIGMAFLGYFVFFEKVQCVFCFFLFGLIQNVFYEQLFFVFVL